MNIPLYFENIESESQNADEKEESHEKDGKNSWLTNWPVVVSLTICVSHPESQKSGAGVTSGVEDVSGVHWKGT
jgi:hypothetical protein